VHSVLVGKTGCPYCSGKVAIPGENDLQTLFPELAAQWDFEKNPGKPGETLPGAHEKVWWNNSEVFIEEMFVLPKKQGQGIGSRLMDALWQYVTEHRLAGLTLSTNRYAPAPAFYRKHGFADCGHVLFMAKETE
jgi:GNAT superfamily N-acetyltransferase